MNEKEISEIRRRFRADKHNIAHIRGCYVNEKKEIIAQFDQSKLTTKADRKILRQALEELEAEKASGEEQPEGTEK